MPQPHNPFVNWTYHKNYTGPRNLPDPRIPVIRHLEWSRSYTAYTTYTLPEPDNYNRAIINDRPQEVEFVKDQIIYRHGTEQWITLMYIPKDDVIDFDQWLGLNAFTFWRHYKSPSLKIYKPMLMRGATRAEMSLDERLLTMGYYKDLVVKYFDGDSTIVKSRLGEARAELIHLNQEGLSYEPE